MNLQSYWPTKENIFENRYMHVPELKRMGANIEIKDRIKFWEKLITDEIAQELNESAQKVI